MQFAVENMTCGHCVRSITSALQQLDPQASVAADLGAGTVEVQGNFSPVEAIAAMATEGYSATEKLDTTSHSAPKDEGTCCGHCHT
jgi:copper chaperone